MTDYRTPYDTHYEAALGLLKAGRSVDEVLQHVDAIGDEDYRDGTLGKMARFFAAQGQMEESLRFCRAIRDPLEYADMLFEVGRELRKNSSLDSAKGVFRQAIEAAGRLKPGAWETPATFLQVSDETVEPRRKGRGARTLASCDRASEAAPSTLRGLEDAGRLRSRPSEMGKYVGGHRGCPGNRVARAA